MAASLLLGSDFLMIGSGGDWVTGTLKIASPYPVAFSAMKKKGEDGKDQVIGHRFSGGYIVRDVSLRREDIDLFNKVKELSSKFPVVLRSVTIAPYRHNIRKNGEYVDEVRDTIFEIEF